MPKVTIKTAKKSRSKVTAKARPAVKLIARKSVNTSSLPGEFVSCDNNGYQFCLGKVVASSFSGFLAGIIVTTLIWIVVVNVFFMG
ncbi:MAG: hypothetical protein WCO55_02515 [Candidatus Falkowbacteria bacterium]